MYFLDLKFNENSMDIACALLNKFDFFIANCYSHLNAFNNCTPDISLIKVRYIIQLIL